MCRVARCHGRHESGCHLTPPLPLLVAFKNKTRHPVNHPATYKCYLTLIAEVGRCFEMAGILHGSGPL
jgi:hypothetical protein